MKMGYRVPATETTPPMLVKRWHARPLCWIIGHRWHVLAINTGKNAGLAHLHPDAGIDQFCTRCGAEWYDAAMVTQSLDKDPKDVKKPKLPPPNEPVELQQAKLLARALKKARNAKKGKLSALSDPPPKVPTAPKTATSSDGLFDAPETNLFGDPNP